MEMFSRFSILLALVALLWLAPTTGWAQDVILDLNGNEFVGQVVEITPTEVIYRAADSDPALPPTILARRTLFMVRFANGAKEVFGVAGAPALPIPPATESVPGSSAPQPTYDAAVGPDGLTLVQRQELRQRGVADAHRYYSTTGPFLGSMAGTILTLSSPYPSLVVGLVKPKAEKNALLDPKLLVYPSYVEGYETTARRRKTWPVVGGYASGVLIIILAITAALNP